MIATSDLSAGYGIRVVDVTIAGLTMTDRISVNTSIRSSRCAHMAGRASGGSPREFVGAGSETNSAAQQPLFSKQIDSPLNLELHC
jgi:hypothetical protein